MSQLIEAFREGGSFMYLVLAVDASAAPLVILAAILAVVGRYRRAAGVVAMALAALGLVAALTAAITGLVGKEYVLSQVADALAVVDPAQRDVLRAVGEADASRDAVFGLGSAVVVGVPSAIALIGAAALVRPRQPDPADRPLLS